MGTDILYRIAGYGFNLQLSLVEVNLPFVFENRAVANKYLEKLRRVGYKLFRFYRQKSFEDTGEKAARWREKADKVAAYGNRLWVEQVEVR